MDFVDLLRSREFWKFQGYASRRQYVQFFIFSFIVMVMYMLATAVLGGVLHSGHSEGGAIFSFIWGLLSIPVWLIFIYTGIAFNVLRVRDIFDQPLLKCPGALVFLVAMFIPYLNFVGFILLLITQGRHTGGATYGSDSWVLILENLGHKLQGSTDTTASGDSTGSGQASATNSTADELAKLAKLKEEGTITEEEFAKAKAKLLGNDSTQ